MSWYTSSVQTVKSLNM